MRLSEGISVSGAIRSRRSHRHYLPDPIPTHTLDRVLELTLEAPSAWNYQGRSIVVVSDPDVRAGLEAATGGQPHPREAPVVLVFLAEMNALVQSSIEECLDDQAFMIPGIADVGDRFFGTVHAGPVR
ncbi:nitroreductase family protein [Rhodococcus sp. IEGM 1330]|uniref:nitroreductase family protein n=1 Tax=Rhodococcus sp. IEGM 1330 TaxID=3082225 RepID=UPI002953A550|nr:nitroreductase family protein [Rhodococcus sp. IEGM 1330]MDV8025291.1 nitroreductase family protein [Rhodococcus sp. IEGM 1330]